MAILKVTLLNWICLTLLIYLLKSLFINVKYTTIEQDKIDFELDIFDEPDYAPRSEAEARIANKDIRSNINTSLYLE